MGGIHWSQIFRSNVIPSSNKEFRSVSCNQNRWNNSKNLKMNLIALYVGGAQGFVYVCHCWVWGTHIFQCMREERNFSVRERAILVGDESYNSGTFV